LLQRRPAPVTLPPMPCRGVHFAAVVVADANSRSRRALRDVVEAHDDVDLVSEAATAL